MTLEKIIINDELRVIRESLINMDGFFTEFDGSMKQTVGSNFEIPTSCIPTNGPFRQNSNFSSNIYPTDFFN